MADISKVTASDGTTYDIKDTTARSDIITINNILSDKMNKNGPTGTGALSINRKENTTVGQLSTAEGYNGTASGMGSHAEGGITTAEGNFSHAEGYGGQAEGVYSHTEGQSTHASGDWSHAEGYGNFATGKGSHAEGGVRQTGTTQYESAKTIAAGDNSHAEGLGTVASSSNQHVFGKYNIADDQNTYIEIVGNGTWPTTDTDPTCSNARTLDWQGNETIAGDLTFNGSTSLASALSGKQDTLVSGTNIKTVNGASILGSGDVTTPRPDNRTIYDTGSVSAASNTWVNCKSWTFPATGIWLVQASLTWDNNSSGYREAGINTSVAQPTAMNIMRIAPCNGQQTTANLTIILTVTSTTQTYYLVERHNSSTSPLTVYPRISLLRLAP